MPGCAAWTQPNLGFQRCFSAPREAAKRAFQPLPAATVQVGKFTPPEFISQFSFYGLVNPSNLLIIWPNLKKSSRKMEDLQKHLKIWQKQGWLVQTWQVYGQDAAQEKIPADWMHCDVAGANHRVAYSWGSEGIISPSWHHKTEAGILSGHGCFLTTGNYGAKKNNCPDYTKRTCVFCASCGCCDNYFDTYLIAICRDCN